MEGPSARGRWNLSVNRDSGDAHVDNSPSLPGLTVLDDSLREPIPGP